MGQRLVVIGVVFTTLALGTAPAGAGIIGCPAGQAIRGVDFVTRSLVCVSVATTNIAALEAALAALQEQVAALHSLTSPHSQYTINVTDGGILLQGPDVSIRLDSGDPASPAPTVTITGTDVVVVAEGTMRVTSGQATQLESSGQTSILSSGTIDMEATGVVTIRGVLVNIN